MIRKIKHDIVTGFIINNRESIYRLAYSYVHNKENALDIVQDSICKALTSVKSLDNQTLLKPWFYRIVVNTALDFLRKNKKYLYLENDVLEAVVPASDDTYQNLDLQNAIENLSAINKTIIVLRFYEDLKLEEIASVLNENVNTIKTRLYSSLKKLKLNLKETDEKVCRDDNAVEEMLINV